MASSHVCSPPIRKLPPSTSRKKASWFVSWNIPINKGFHKYAGHHKTIIFCVFAELIFMHFFWKWLYMNYTWESALDIPSKAWRTLVKVIPPPPPVWESMQSSILINWEGGFLLFICVSKLHSLTYHPKWRIDTSQCWSPAPEVVPSPPSSEEPSQASQELLVLLPSLSSLSRSLTEWPRKSYLLIIWLCVAKNCS